MKIIERIKNKAEALYSYRQPVIAFTGDSVTQGCFEVYVKEGGSLDTVFDATEAYSQKVKEILAMLFPSANVTVVNAGISGSRAELGIERLENEVLSFRPDLTVVCYGLNDANRRAEGLERYKTSLRKIFVELKKAGTEVIFMTPNMCTDRVDFSINDKVIEAAAARVVETVKGGWLERYVEEARRICAEENIPVCDCYAIWKRLYENGVDVTSLLSNKINHPTKEMHWLFAYELVKTMLEN